jgi:hypothetical protein
MVNKDQLEQTEEGRQVLALMAENFTAEQFQPALTLIEQRYTEDLTVWDAELNHDSKLPFNRANPAQRLLIFFASPDHLAIIKDELEQHEAEHERQIEEAAAERDPVQKIPGAKTKARGKTTAKRDGSARKVRSRKVKAAKATRKKSPVRRRSSTTKKRVKQKGLSVKTRKPLAKRSRKASKRKKR